MRKLILAIASGAVVFAALPAAAQYYEPYGRPQPQYRYDEQPREWRQRPPPGYGYQRPQYYQPMGRVCVTSRGACGIRPAPVSAPCQCYFEGFGRKRGNVE